MSTSKHVCLRVGEPIPGSHQLLLNLVIAGQNNVTGNAILSQGGVQGSSLEFAVKGRISILVNGAEEIITLYLEGETYIQTGGTLLFQGVTDTNFQKGMASYVYKPETGDTVEVTRQSVVRIDCKQA